ncbi:hypothetical protein Pcinc_028267 [Petrolisthes cinctipes]|uniref:Uncharacterized protein n=1 Tax=Petrolisthes cinctipes TaxID=88211 RepID=A0AAE1F3A0_PETCI|nr:hypothetical protein Pcinc_028267 [Petrolisthes cinctipes]
MAVSLRRGKGWENHGGDWGEGVVVVVVVDRKRVWGNRGGINGVEGVVVEEGGELREGIEVAVVVVAKRDLPARKRKTHEGRENDTNPIDEGCDMEGRMRPQREIALEGESERYWTAEVGRED